MPESRNMTEVNPPGMIQAFAQSTAPSGWLPCNGGLINRTTYSALFAAIGTRYGTTDGSNFALPDLRGEFLRGWDASRGIDTNEGVQPRGFGTVQKGTAFAYNLPWNEGLGGAVTAGNDDTPWAGRSQVGTDYVTQGDYGATSSMHLGGPQNNGNWITDGGWGGGASRPRNFALLYCIKF